MGSDSLPEPIDLGPGLDRMKLRIQRERGFNWESYKEKCLIRRVAVRMRARGTATLEEYEEILDRDPAEYDRLLETLTINVSKFFRNPEIWESIRDRVVPPLFESAVPVRRIWSAGCASGEEPYSISILLHEWAERHAGRHQLDRFRIFGTDIDRRSLDAARAASYPEIVLDETPPDLRARWFSDGPPFQLDPRATSMVEFEHRDLISDPPLMDLSLIVCRNVIIYFDREVQERLFQRFHDALLPGGILVLGKVETLLGRARSLFEPVLQRQRIFRKPG
jgi:chemotaxis protein methyltransferase CheR